MRVHGLPPAPPPRRPRPDFADCKAMPKYVVSSPLAEDDLVPNRGETTILRPTDEAAALKDRRGRPDHRPRQRVFDVVR